MRVTSRRKAIAFFITLSAVLIALAVALNVGWIILNWREVGLLVFGAIFFSVLIAGLILNTIFLVREIRRNEQQDGFLNAVTHELKTPLTSIRLYLETLQSRDVAESQKREFYQVMLADTKRLMGTVEQVLKAAEVSHRNRHPVSDVDMEALVQECVELARSRHHLPAESLAAQGQSNGNGKVYVRGDAEELRTAISNVLDNAVQYSGDKVKVVAQVAAADGRRVQVRVRDEGVGIPRSELKRVFRRFYRVLPRPGQAPAGGVKGTGLGLFIVGSIARRHGGSAYAESEGDGRGTTVIIDLPKAEA